MKDGNISNIVNPYIAFDIDCVLYVSAKDRWKVKFYESLMMHKRAAMYYRKVPRSGKVLDMLMRVGYNIMFVYIGPQRYWKSKMYTLNFLGIPFTTLNCVKSQHDFYDSLVREDKVLQYNGLSQIAVHAAGPKGRLFQNWDMFLMSHSGIQPGAVGQVFSRG